MRLMREEPVFIQKYILKTEMICGDITDESIRNCIVEKAIEKGVNFIIATPPCQGMSVAGNRDPEDPRNQLISYAIDIIKKSFPRFCYA